MAKNDKYYGFDTDSLNKKLEGSLTYINTFCVNNEYSPVAVYKVANPNRHKGHKDYVLLQVNYCPLTGEKEGAIIRGMAKEEMSKWQYQEGIRCLKCNDEIFSMNRHTMTYCACKAVAIDGGKEYTKVLGYREDFEYITIDLLKE